MLSLEAVISLILLALVLSLPLHNYELKRYFAYEKANNMAKMLVGGADKAYLDELAGGYCYEIDDEKRCEGQYVETWHAEWRENIKKRIVRVYLR